MGCKPCDNSVVEAGDFCAAFQEGWRLCDYFDENKAYVCSEGRWQEYACTACEVFTWDWTILCR
jgi:hypothetical protein